MAPEGLSSVVAAGTQPGVACGAGGPGVGLLQAGEAPRSSLGPPVTTAAARANGRAPRPRIGCSNTVATGAI